MEIFAVIQGLRALKESCIVNLYTDSSYVSDAFNKAWIAAWQKNNWRTASKKEVKNQDLWRALLYETHKHKISFIHVQGHADNEFNNRCDRLAREAIETCRKNNENNLPLLTSSSFLSMNSPHLYTFINQKPDSRRA